MYIASKDFPFARSPLFVYRWMRYIESKGDARLKSHDIHVYSWCVTQVLHNIAHSFESSRFASACALTCVLHFVYYLAFCVAFWHYPVSVEAARNSAQLCHQAPTCYIYVEMEMTEHQTPLVGWGRRGGRVCGWVSNRVTWGIERE